MLQREENKARSRGCVSAKLSTFSFQARDFYEKLGYKIVGQMSDYPPEESFYWMRKQLQIGTDNSSNSAAFNS